MRILPWSTSALRVLLQMTICCACLCYFGLLLLSFMCFFIFCMCSLICSICSSAKSLLHSKNKNIDLAQGHNPPSSKTNMVLFTISPATIEFCMYNIMEHNYSWLKIKLATYSLPILPWDEISCKEIPSLRRGILLLPPTPLECFAQHNKFCSTAATDFSRMCCSTQQVLIPQQVHAMFVLLCCWSQLLN